MRDFLLDKKIVGALMTSRCGGILEYTIPELMKWVDYSVIMLDFPDENTVNIVNKYKDIYKGRIETFESGVPNYIGTRNKEHFEKTDQGMFQRFNALQGQIREKMLGHIQDKIRGGENIDMSIWMDSVTGDTPILIEQDGIIDFIEISSLISKKNSHLNNIGKSCMRKNINQKISVLTKNGFKKIKYVKCHKIKKPLYHISDSDGICRITGDHSLFVNGEMKKGSEIKMGDKIDKVDFIDNNNFNCITEKFAKLLGFFVAEGHASIVKGKTGCQYNWNLSEKNKELLISYGEIMKEYYGNDYYLIEDKKKGYESVWRLWIRNPKKPCNDFMDWCYSGSKKKKVPKIILNGSKDIIKYFLEGYYEGDGHFRRKKQYVSDSNSFLLSAGIFYISKKIGTIISPRIKKEKKNIITLCELLKSKKAISKKTTGVRYVIKDDDYDGYVYDICTEDGTFVGGVGNILFKNSDEILNDSMKEILINFANNPKKKGLILKAIDVFNDFNHILPASMGTHLRVIKPELNQHVLPYMGLAKIHNINKPLLERHLNVYTHMYMLTKEKREWRAKHWRYRDRETYLNMPLWKTEKKSTELSQKEVQEIFKKPPDLTIGEYLKINKLKI